MSTTTKAQKEFNGLDWIQFLYTEELPEAPELPEEQEDRLCPCGDGYKESGCPDGCSGGCCISCCGVGEDEYYSSNEDEVCCGGCNGEICNDCPVDNSSIKDLN